MKAFRLALALLILGGCIESELDPAAVPSPRIEGSWVHDGAQVIGHRDSDINALVDDLEASTGAEVAVVTVFSIGDEVPKEFATSLFNAWGIGKKGEDNGVLVLHVIDQRRVEIETGYGIEGVLTDARAQLIIDEVTLPFFMAESFADGHYETVRAIDFCLRNDGQLGDLTGRWKREPGTVRQYATPSAPVAARTRLVVPSPWGLGLLGAVVIWMLGLYIARRRSESERALHLHEKSGVVVYLAAALGAVWVGAEVWPWIVTLGIALPAALFSVFFFRRRTTAARPDVRRACTGCGSHLRAPLPEAEEDAFLSKAQQAEEAVGAYDYDVWACPCGEVRVESRASWGTPSSCPGCSHRTVTSSSQLVRAPTTEAAGLVRISVSCALCSFGEVTERTLNRLDGSVSGFSIGTPVYGPGSAEWQGSSAGSYRSGYSGGRSSSRGGSFGGGSSGGGGAGGSY